MKSLKERIRFLRQCFLSVVQENEWRDLKQYGCIAASANLKKPLVVANPKGFFMYPFSRIQANATILNYTGRFIIKTYAVCSNNLTVVTGNHTPTVGIPQFFLGITHLNDKETDVIIEEGAWIGANVTLISGAKIGRGAVIGACSMVNKEIPPYAVAVGIPARIIASTFSKQQIIEHEKAVFKPEDRLPEKTLDLLFEQYYKGLNSIGTSDARSCPESLLSKINETLSAYPYCSSLNNVSLDDC